MSDPQNIYRIVEWAQRYEPKKRYSETDKPLDYVKLAVFAPQLGPGYVDLFMTAGDPAFGAMAFAVFAKCLELAASRRRPDRDGRLIGHRDEPADARYISRITMLPEEVCGRCLDLLVRVNWLELVPADTPVVRATGKSWQEADPPSETVRPQEVAAKPTDGHDAERRGVDGSRRGVDGERRTNVEGSTAKPDLPLQPTNSETNQQQQQPTNQPTAAIATRRNPSLVATAAVGCAEKTDAAAGTGPPGRAEFTSQATLGERIVALNGILAELGVGMPTRRELAVLWGPVGDAQRRIREIGLEFGNKGKGKGILVNELRAAGEAERIRRKQAVSFWLNEMAKREPEAVADAVNAAIAKLPTALQERAHKLGVRGEAIWPELIAELRRQGWRRVGSFDRTVGPGAAGEPQGA